MARDITIELGGQQLSAEVVFSGAKILDGERLGRVNVTIIPGGNIPTAMIGESLSGNLALPQDFPNLVGEYFEGQFSGWRHDGTLITVNYGGACFGGEASFSVEFLISKEEPEGQPVSRRLNLDLQRTSIW